MNEGGSRGHGANMGGPKPPWVRVSGIPERNEKTRSLKQKNGLRTQLQNEECKPPLAKFLLGGEWKGPLRPVGRSLQVKEESKNCTETPVYQL